MKSKWIFFTLLVFFPLFSNLTVNKESELRENRYTTPGFYIPFKATNGSDAYNDDIIFGRYSYITRGLQANYYLNVPNDQAGHEFYFPVNYLDKHEGIYYGSTDPSFRFSERNINLSTKDTVRVYWYPPTPLPPDEFFDDLDREKWIPDKIVVYEMNETEIFMNK